MVRSLHNCGQNNSHGQQQKTLQHNAPIDRCTCLGNHQSGARVLSQCANAKKQCAMGSTMDHDHGARPGEFLSPGWTTGRRAERHESAANHLRHLALRCLAVRVVRRLHCYTWRQALKIDRWPAWSRRRPLCPPSLSWCEHRARAPHQPHRSHASIAAHAVGYISLVPH